MADDKTKAHDKLADLDSADSAVETEDVTSAQAQDNTPQPYTGACPVCRHPMHGTCTHCGHTPA